MVVMFSYPAKAIEIRGPIAISILFFFVAPFATKNDE